jgi:1-acyl-sn-glycerol-3-phosphate acyltransferase
MASDSALDRLLGSLPAPVEGWLRMLEAIATDFARILGRSEPDDPLEWRDPEYIRRTLPTLRLMSSIYFRAEVRGLANVPRDGGALLVGNHSGGILIADSFVFGQALYDHLTPSRRFHQLAHDMVFKVPGAGGLLRRYGTIPASRENAERALRAGAAVLVYPGGDFETYRPSWESTTVDFGGRTGFVEQALELGVPIVPVVALGGQETALFLGRGQRLAKLTGFDRLTRIKVLPVSLGPPFGVNVLDLPGRIPLPAKIRLRVLPPIDLERRLGPEPDPEAGYELITGSMQDALDGLADERAVPVVG